MGGMKGGWGDWELRLQGSQDTHNLAKKGVTWIRLRGPPHPPPFYHQDGVVGAEVFGF